jgi:hypothetical protein
VSELMLACVQDPKIRLCIYLVVVHAMRWVMLGRWDSYHGMETEYYSRDASFNFYHFG